MTSQLAPFAIAFDHHVALPLSGYIWQNVVAPGPIWTPLIPATMPPEKVKQFGKSVPMKQPAQPEEIAPCYVFLASQDSSYLSGQVLHPNGGDVING